MFNSGFDIKPLYDPLGFEYDQNVFGPIVENRSLDAIRKNLMDPDCTGPDIVYTIAMDVGRKEDKENMLKRNLLYGVVTYAKGKLGKEPVRSQGHIHAISPSCQMSTCEVYEIWTGAAYIYMQESAEIIQDDVMQSMQNLGMLSLYLPDGLIVRLWQIFIKI